MRADKTHFFLEASLDAYEDDRRLASRNWQERIARDMM